MGDKAATSPQTILFFLYHPLILTHGGTCQTSYVPVEMLPRLQHSPTARYPCCSPPCPFPETPLS